MRWLRVQEVLTPMGILDFIFNKSKKVFNLNQLQMGKKGGGGEYPLRDIKEFDIKFMNI